jgi:hypothetical protein
MRHLFFSLICLLPITATADPEVITRLLNQEATPAHFEFCHGGGCAATESISLADEEWEQVSLLFASMPENALEERERIAQAIALLENIIGVITETATDRGGNFEGIGTPGQLDCFDESVNTTSYLKMLRENNFLRFHEIAGTRTRGYFLRGWPHTTAILREIGTDQVYAVDSWFYDNGEPPVILPLQVWQDGWDIPKQSTVKSPDGTTEKSPES